MRFETNRSKVFRLFCVSSLWQLVTRSFLSPPVDRLSLLIIAAAAAAAPAKKDANYVFFWVNFYNMIETL